MNEGGYSRIEKDFLGNERMVHYDGSGNMTGASDVVREPDGTIRIPNEASSSAPSIEPPKVEVVEPKPNPVASKPLDIREGYGRKSGMPMSQVVTYAIAAFIATSLLTLGYLSFFRSKGNDASVRTTPPSIPQRRVDPPIDSVPDRTRSEDLPVDPKPRNDEQAPDPRPFDQAAPDANMDDSRPRIRPNDIPGDPGPSTPTGEKPKPEPKPKKSGSDEPIDLRGDDSGKKDPPKKGNSGGDPLKGDDIH